MSIKKIEDFKIWNDFFCENGSPSFLQSWEWGNLQKKLGYEIIRLGIYDKNDLLAISLVIRIRAKRGSFLFAPHGPILKFNISDAKTQSCVIKLRDYLIDLAKKESFSFIRFAPILENTSNNKQIFKSMGFKIAPIYMHAETIWSLPITDGEDELLSKMRKTTRYSIRKAERDGVTIEKRRDAKAIDDFYGLYLKTADREQFVPFSTEYIKKEYEEFSKKNNCLFLFAKLKSEYLAGALVIFTKSTGFYHQGASIHTKVPAPYLLQWSAISEAKKRGCEFYNFWGVFDEESKRMPKAWTGLTLFKTGFGGNKICYLPTQDYIISPNYYLIYLWEKLIGWKRGV